MAERLEEDENRVIRRWTAGLGSMIWKTKWGRLASSKMIRECLTANNVVWLASVVLKEARTSSRKARQWHEHGRQDNDTLAKVWSTLVVMGRCISGQGSLCGG